PTTIGSSDPVGPALGSRVLQAPTETASRAAASAGSALLRTVSPLNWRCPRRLLVPGDSGDVGRGHARNCPSAEVGRHERQRHDAKVSGSLPDNDGTTC